MAFSLTWHNNNIHVKAFGTITFDDFYNSNNKIYGDARFEKMKYQLIDFSELEDGYLSLDDIKVIGNLEKSASRWNRNLKMAIVSLAPKWLEGLSPYMEELSETGWEIQMFESIDEALNWCESN